ncbi:Alkaline phosphatase synthesis transcriptional regulatory protein PhoP [Thermoflexales bacterium]|nr:Alkaline phosphatase synthesis transcriptional regulatory protein PhoP [Thermoflexales bacterium]
MATEEPAMDRQPANAELPASLGPYRRVLVVDDEANLRQTFARILHQMGCEVTTASDGAEALQRLEVAPYDLVYLDIRLPGMDGLQVLRQIHDRYTQLAVVLLTAYASIKSAVEAVRLGATDYLIKPITPEALMTRTRSILADQAVQRRRREIQQQIDALQVELKMLDQDPQATATFVSPTDDRFLKRGTLLFDLHTRRATCVDRILTLPPTAFDYLVVLARHAPDVVPYQTLVVEAQGYQTDLRQAQELTKWHIHMLREALERESAGACHLLTVRGTGYRLVVD